jgi:hypothetical protein
MLEFKITFEEVKDRHICQEHPFYNVMLNGKFYFQIYYNLRGYCGYLPTPRGGRFDPGEVSLARFRKEAKILEREAKELAKETA